MGALALRRAGGEVEDDLLGSAGGQRGGRKEQREYYMAYFHVDGLVGWLWRRGHFAYTGRTDIPIPRDVVSSILYVPLSM